MDRLSTKGQMIDQIDLRNVPHSGFDRSNHNFGSGRLGAIIPTRLDEVYPGDRIKGRPETVANFEPLVAPIMGSMVLKQESFFVPYPQLWKNAYKFFTGKNGFNSPMPSISPRSIFEVYYSYVHKYIFSPSSDNYFSDFLGTLYYYIVAPNNEAFSDLNENHYELLQWLVVINEQIERQFKLVYDSRKMYDLVMPVVKLFKDLTTNNEIIEISNKLEHETLTTAARESTVMQILLIIGDCYRDYFNYFHGPSSLFDYLGWPTVTDLNVYNNGFKLTPMKVSLNGDTFVISDVFTYDLYQNVVLGLHFDLRSYIVNLFSNVPLVFNPFKAYYLIWYWNYRDQLLETDILDPDEDEFLGDTITDNVILYCTLLRQRCWFKDTFTTALTNTGDGNLLVPVGDSQSDALGHPFTDIKFYDISDKLVDTTDVESAMTSGASYAEITNGLMSYKIPINYLSGAYSQSDPFVVSHDKFVSLDLFDRIRRLREVLQKRLILGYEVDDVVYSSFAVRMSNIRIHIPEILGTGRDSIVINTLVNNTSTNMQIAGDKTATAFGHGVQSDMNYFSEEWGLFFSFMTILPIQSYAGGLQRLYLKRDALDYAWPEFATMGMDAVYNTELASLGTRLTDEQGLMVFGYQGRYYDLKSRLDEEHGRLLTDLNYLTFSREWDKNNPPKLNYIFVHCWPRLDGFVIDSPLMDIFRFDCYNAQAWERRLPVPSNFV